MIGLVIYFLLRFLLSALGVSYSDMGYGVLTVFKYLTLISLPHTINEPSSLLAVWLGALNYSVFVIFLAVLSIFRLHDLNKPGWWTILNFVPLVNLLFGLYVFMAKGKAEINQYGLPRLTRGWEKVLGWIYIVLFPLFILLIVAVSAMVIYQNHVDHNQMVQESGYAWTMDHPADNPLTLVPANSNSAPEFH